MDNEQMRRVSGALARRCMGWMKMYLPEWDTDVWMEPSDDKDKWLVVEGMYDWRDFKPWESWPHVGLIIEAMLERRWDCNIWIDARGWSSVTWQSWNGETLGEAKCDTFCEAVALAAYRALESANG